MPMMPCRRRWCAHRNGGADPFALIVLEITGDRFTSMTSFLDTDTLFPLFGLPPTFPA